MASFILLRSLQGYAATGPDPLLVKGTVIRDPEGYFVQRRSLEYVKLLDSTPGYVKRRGMKIGYKCTLPAEFPLVGAIQESEGQFNVIGGVEGKRLMVIYSDFKADGGGVVMAPYMINAEIKGGKAIVLLAEAVPKTSRALWKISWSDMSTYMYEVYFDDYFGSNNRPQRTRKDILELLEHIVCSPV